MIRAFTTVAYAFGAGAERIVLVGTVDEARALAAAHPDWLTMGEVRGRPIPGFDLSNSPVDAAAADLDGRTLVQRTSAGTQGVVRATAAREVWCASLVCASATAMAVASIDPTYVITGWLDDELGHDDGDEDVAAAELIHALRAGPVDPAPFVDRVRRSIAAARIVSERVQADPRDIDLACEVDRFDQAMRVRRQEGLLVLTAAKPGTLVSW